MLSVKENYVCKYIGGVWILLWGYFTLSMAGKLVKADRKIITHKYLTLMEENL